MNQNLDFGFIWDTGLLLLERLPTTLLISFVPMICGTLLAIGIALVRIYRIPVINQMCILYVSFIRGTPTIVQLLLVFYGLPWATQALVGLVNPSWAFDFNKMPAETFAIVALTIATSAYSSELLRSAIESVDRGQLEAAESIGLRPWQVMVKIVFPQAALNALPNLGNTLLGLIKDSSLAFTVSVVDIMGMAKIVGARSLRFLECYFAVSIIYWIVCIVVELVVKLAERRLSVSRRSLAQ
ncbi:MAG: amino acid ABC transporter permease [Coriobacteriales bacterium]|nr:amino acid ABC transporter permease [Coriobacteriales bacterium]